MTLFQGVENEILYPPTPGVQRGFAPLAGVFRGQRPLNGGSWTRTNEDRSREIYSLLPLPLGDTPVGWCWQ